MGRLLKAQSHRHFSFRIPMALYEQIAAVAEVRGIDVSAVINWMLSESQPRLLREIADHAREIREALARVEAERIALSNHGG